MSACGCGAPYQGRWLLKALLFLAAVLPTSGDCPKSCVCNVPTEVHCTFRYLTAVPDHIQPAVERINLGYNSISVLRENDLSGLENLELLMLHSNTIHSIYNRAFQDLKSLQVLKMSFNKVKEIKKETFKGLDNLLRIHMDHNNIEFISPEAFYGLNKLQLVHLEGNHLQQLHPDTFITLRHSQVFKVSSVRTIHLSENLLTTLPEEIFLGCSQLENLFLHGNPWTCDCRMKWFSVWAQRNTGVLKCKRDRRYPRGQLCPVCENPAPYHNTPLFLLSGDAFTCTKPWIQPHLKQKNISLDEGDFTPVSPKDFIAPLGSIQMNLTDHFHNDASLSCTVQRPSTFENLTQTLEEEEGNNATVLTAGIITYLVCNIDYEHIQQLWHILATYSDSPMTLERGFMLARRPEMVYRYSQIKTKEGEEGIYTNIVAEIKASPEWLMQGEVSFQLDRTTTTFSTLHIKYQSVINLRVENTSPKRGHYSWTMIKRDNQTKTEHTVLTGGVVQLDCQIWGEPKPLLEWILPDGNKVRGPYSSEDRRLIITAEGKLTLRGADASETGLYRCITTNYLDADILAFRVTVLSPDVEEAEVNGSTIISRQQIHIIPRKNSRGGGRRRTFQGRRRIIKPNRITDIQSFINKLQKPSLMKEGNATVPYRIELTTDCDWDEDKKKTAKKTATTDLQPVTPTVSSSSSLDRTERPASTQNTAASTTTYYITSNTAFIQTESRQEVSSGFITSADAPEFDPTIDPLLTSNKEPSISTTTTTTTVSKVIRGRIPWNRLFGGREREKILGRLREPSITQKHSTTAETTTMTPTTTPAAIPTTTANSLSEPRTLSPPRHTGSKEGSLDDDYGYFSSADFEFTTLRPSFNHLTPTSPSYYSKSATTAETPPESQTLPSPPTVQPPSIENPNEALSSGSGGLPDNWSVIRQRPDGSRGRQGRRRKPFSGRRPFNKPTITRLRPATTTEDSTTTRETAMRTTTLSQSTVSLYKPIYTPSRQEDRTPIVVSTDQTSKEENDLYEEFDWNTSSGLRAYTTTKTPLIYSTTFNPTTTFIPITTKGPYTTARTKVHSNIRPPAQRNSDHTTRGPPVRRIRPTAQISSARNSAGKGLHTVTIVSAVQRYTNTPAPYNNIGTQKAISSVYNHVAGNEATSANIAGFEPTANVKTSKPKIVGGIAASFTVLSNSDAFLPCEAVGNPQPAITWKRFHSNTGTTVTVKGRMGKFEVLSNGTLSIQNANIKDRGQYLCLAENDYGSDKLLVTLSVVTYPSRILEPTMRDIKSHAGNNVEMTCKAEGRPIPMISWILANQTQVRGQNTEKGRVSVSTDGTLVIEQVSVYDRGHYKCIASNPAGADTATVRLQVVAAPPGIVEEKRQQVKVGVSQNLWLPCTGQGSPQPTIHWVLHDGSTVRYNRPASDTRVSVYRNGTLHIKDVTQEDSGKYECIATSSTGSERMVVTLTVERQESAPQIMETSKRVTALFFEDQLRLSCSATGDPKPRIIWRLPSKAVVDQWHRMGSRIQVLDNGTLIIGLVSDKDAGDYLCVARNKIGDDLQLMKVSVSMKPAKIEPKLYGKKQVPYGKDFKVDCKASGAPKPEISWGLPDGTVVNSALQSDASSGGGRPRRYTLFDNGTLHLNQVGMSEEGDYTCYAENQVGKDEMHFHITVVTAAARIRPTSQTYVRVKPGGKIRFDCEALGEPKPKILWMLPTNDVIAASNERYLMHVNGSLDIRDVKLIDAGEYVCMARNPAGENRKVYKLDIEGNPPVINGYWQNRTVIKDVAAKYSRKFIDCKAEGDPMPSITWIMPDNIFLKAPYYGSRINVHHNGTLEIRNVRPTDTAEFICMARNDGGEAVMVVQLEVSSILRRPIFKNPFNERIVSRIGKTTVLNCSADGYPVPEITWTLPNGTRITSGHHLVRNGTLVIYDSGNEDAGKYRCGAKNFIGYIEKLIILDVGQKPYILTRPRGIIRSVSGEPLFLHCLSDGSPRPKIHWTIPSGHTLTRPQVLGRYQLLENGTLVVQDTTLHDRGNYICRARSDAGEAVLTVPVVIIAYPPRITLGPPPSVRSLTGTPIQLNCAAIGIPKPEITWELPNRSVLSAAEQGRPMGSELLHPQGTLIIQRPKASDSGTYKCLAKNLLGTDSKITYVHIF
ncbi:hypothetical protein VZT92_020819 [Zoarces viviparus]|uniref:Ig-like domain-containing protein n=1 Tax=Zoarces viviparus TaxID=48416 RepID=A0AAW1EEV7_ZOAVI